MVMQRAKVEAKTGGLKYQWQIMQKSVCIIHCVMHCAEDV